VYDHRLDLAAIRRALLDVQAAFPRINAHLEMRREAMSDRVVAFMMDGYAQVDRLLAERADAFEMGQLSALLELNHRVLCGADPDERRHHHRHLEATEHAFYDDARGGIRDVREWYERNRQASVWRRAAGVYVRILTEPQLYIEGNHRTGALIMSYLLAREGQPPFVLTVDNAAAYFRPSTLIRRTRKSAPTSIWRIPQLIGAFAEYLRTTAQGDLLIPATSVSAADPAR
jgi:prophage maintenance system killer protein